MSFPSSPLDLRCDLDVGSWTNVTAYLYQRDGLTAPVAITRGRQDESSTVTAAQCTFEANNRSGNWSPKNPLGAWYGSLGRNTPVRFSVPAQVNYMRLETDDTSFASCPDATGLHITGDMEVQLDLKLTDWQPCTLATRWASSSNKTWALYLRSDGTIAFEFWDGTTDRAAGSTIPLPVQERIAVRATLQVAPATVTFYTAASIGGTWTQLGSQVLFGASVTLSASTAPVAVGYSSGYIVTDNHSSYTGPNGEIYEFRLYSGIAGTLKANPVFSSQAAGTTSFSDAQSNTWTLGGTAELSSRNYRGHFETSSLPGKWDVTGNDVSVPLTCGGLMRRIGQGQAPVQSPMKRAILSQSGTLQAVQYWPAEDGTGASALGSATGGPLMTFSGAPQLASDSSFLCSAPLPVLNDTAWYGQVPAYTSNGSIVFRFLMKLGSTLPAGTWALVRLITSGTCQELSFRTVSNTTLQLAGFNASGTVFSDSANFGADFAGGVVTGVPLWVSMELTPGGGSTVDYQLAVLQPGASQAFATSGTFAGTIGNVQAAYVSPGANYPDTVIGHLSLQSAWVSLFSLASPLNAWQGETAGNRFARLAAENGHQARIIGPPASTVAMGAQPVDTLGNLLQECEDADRGQIFEPRACLGLGYRTLASMCNQAAAAALDYSLAEMGGVSGDGSDGGLDPTYDDQLTRNDWTVTRSAGSVSGATYQYQLDDGSAMSISGPPAGIGDYSDTLSVNVDADSQLPDQAGWMVHVGSVDEARWPSVPLNLARAELSSLYYTLLGCDIGDFAEMVNLPQVQVSDPVKQLVFQVKESLGGFHHTLEWNCVPESPYEVLILDDAVYGYVDTDGSTLHAGITSGATSMQVDIATGKPLWTTAAADFPFDIKVSGERMTVTNITGSSSPQTFTITRAVNGVVKAQSATADVRRWYPPTLALT